MNTIYKFDVAKLYNLGHHDKDAHVIRCRNILNDAYQKIDNNNDSLLFDQIRKALGKKVKLEEVIIVMDFANFANNILQLQNYQNGFELEDENGNKATFKIFVKSNSMSRSFECYYINAEYEEKIMKRISFDLTSETSEVSMSKWGAYLGLTCSSAQLCKNIHLTSEEVAIIDDKEDQVNTECLTAVSISYLLTLLDKIDKNFDNIDVLNKIEQELECYKGSIDYPLLDELKGDSDKEKARYEDAQILKTLLDELMDALTLEPSELKSRCKALNNKYNKFIQVNDKDIWHKMHVSNYPIKVNFFDGVGLINKELQSDICSDLGLKEHSDNEYDDLDDLEGNNYSFQIRLPFIKGMVHTCDLQGFFKEHKIKSIKSIKNFVNNEKERYELKDASKIKMIITESQFKGSKYFKTNKVPSHVGYYFELLRRYDYPLAIANIETRQDKRGRFNYQFLTTLPLEEDDVARLINSSKEEIKRRGELASIKNAIDFASDDEFDPDRYVINYYEDYYKATKRYDNKRNDNMEAEIVDSLVGKIRCESSRRYLAPDLLELLYHSIGKELPVDQKLSINKFYAPYTKKERDNRSLHSTNYDNQVNLILRNPHYSRNEIVVSFRDTCTGKERDKYFGDLYGVLMINPLSFYADRLGGADYDGDSVLMVFDSRFIINIRNNLLDANDKFVHPFAKIPSLVEKAKKPSYDNKIKSLSGTFSNETGKISNYAFKKAVLEKNNPNIHDDLAFFTILSGLEIDSAKTGKKPYLPIKKTDKNVFLKMKEAIKENNQKSEFYYTKKSLKKNIKEILEQKGNDYHLIYQIDDAILDFEKPKNEFYNKVNAYNELNIPASFNKNGALKVKGIIDAYNKLKSKNQEVSKAREMRFVNLGIIKNKINTILNSYYNIDDFLMEFKTPQGKTTLSLYTTASKNGNSYHFMTNQEDKIDFIKNVLHLSLSEKVMNIVTNFKNEGYQLLYLALLYYKEYDELNSTVDLINVEPSKTIKDMNEKDKQVALEARNYVINKITAIHDVGSWKYQDLIDAVKTIANNDFDDISFVEVAHAVNLIKDEYQFDIFGEKMVNYLENEREDSDFDEYEDYE